jgi:NTP pyrophosphatase (non-canonical NTP hydrolase)
MNWTFPEIKTTRNIDERFQKILDELNELNVELKVGDKKNIEKEALDVYHSTETFIRLLFKGREKDLDEIVKKTIEKNQNRGYYTEECF